VQHFLSSRLDLESDNLSRKSTAVAALDQLSAGTASFVIFTGLITVAIPVTVPVPRNEVACPLTLRFLLTIPVTHGGHRFALGSPRRPRGYRLATTGWYVTRVCFVWRILLSEWHDFMDAAGPLHSSQYSNGAVHCTVDFFFCKHGCFIPCRHGRDACPSVQCLQHGWTRHAHLPARAKPEVSMR